MSTRARTDSSLWQPIADTALKGGPVDGPFGLSGCIRHTYSMLAVGTHYHMPPGHLSQVSLPFLLALREMAQSQRLSRRAQVGFAEVHAMMCSYFSIVFLPG